MDSRSFVRAMFERGHEEWNYPFEAGYLSQMIAGYLRGFISKAELSKQYGAIEAAEFKYKTLLELHHYHDDVIDALRAWATGSPAGSESPAGEGSPRD